MHSYKWNKTDGSKACQPDCSVGKGLQEHSLGGGSLHCPDIGGNSDRLECISEAEGDLLSLQNAGPD